MYACGVCALTWVRVSGVMVGCVRVLRVRGCVLTYVRACACMRWCALTYVRVLRICVCVCVCACAYLCV